MLIWSTAKPLPYFHNSLFLRGILTNCSSEEIIDDANGFPLCWDIRGNTSRGLPQKTTYCRFHFKSLGGDQKKTPAVLIESGWAASMWHAAKVIYQKRILTTWKYAHQPHNNCMNVSLFKQWLLTVSLRSALAFFVLCSHFYSLSCPANTIKLLNHTKNLKKKNSLKRLSADNLVVQVNSIYLPLPRGNHWT